jgi:integrase
MRFDARWTRQELTRYLSDPGRLTVGEYLQSWLTDTARYQVSEGTYSRYERTCRNHLVPFFGRIKLREMS